MYCMQRKKGHESCAGILMDIAHEQHARFKNRGEYAKPVMELYEVSSRDVIRTSIEPEKGDQGNWIDPPIVS